MLKSEEKTMSPAEQSLAELSERQYQDMGVSLAVNPDVSFRFNFARRWCAMAETGYIISAHDMETIGKKQIQSFNLGFGIGYRYK